MNSLEKESRFVSFVFVLIFGNILLLFCFVVVVVDYLLLFIYCYCFVVNLLLLFYGCGCGCFSCVVAVIIAFVGAVSLTLHPDKNI